MKDLFTPILDYFYTRKCKQKCLVLFISLIPSVALMVLTLLLDARADFTIISLFSEFVSSQITIMAILLSFSIAFLTIIATADNKNIETLKHESASEKNYKPIKGKKEQPTLFQILLSGITFIIVFQVIYLFLLIIEGIGKAIIPDCAYKYLVVIDVFMISFIFLGLLELVVNIYYVFWKEYQK